MNGTNPIYVQSKENISKFFNSFICYLLGFVPNFPPLLVHVDDLQVVSLVDRHLPGISSIPGVGDQSYGHSTLDQQVSPLLLTSVIESSIASNTAIVTLCVRQHWLSNNLNKY